MNRPRQALRTPGEVAFVSDYFSEVVPFVNRESKNPSTFVELIGIEPTTSAMPCRRTPSET
jgi:hypothetical protein